MYFRRLRDMREYHDFKQREIAEKLGIAQTVYSRYERGARTIPIEYLIFLSKLYRVSCDYLLGLTDDPERHTKD